MLCLALHDCKSIDFLPCIRWLASFSESHHWSPDCFFYHANEKNRKARSFKSLEKAVLDGGVTSIEVMQLAHRNPVEVFDWTFSFCADEDLGSVCIAPLGEDEPERVSAATIALQLKQFCAFRYGYAYHRPLSKGPMLYHIGLSTGSRFLEPDEAETERIAGWQHYLAGLAGSFPQLRDVYEYNLLSPAHLALVIEDRVLAAWIEAQPDRGSLHLLTDGIYEWVLAAQNIAKVRVELDSAGLLVKL